MNEQLQSTCCEQLALSSRLDYKELENTRPCFLPLKLVTPTDFSSHRKQL